MAGHLGDPKPPGAILEERDLDEVGNRNVQEDGSCPPVKFIQARCGYRPRMSRFDPRPSI